MCVCVCVCVCIVTMLVVTISICAFMENHMRYNMESFQYL